MAAEIMAKSNSKYNKDDHSNPFTVLLRWADAGFVIQSYDQFACSWLAVSLLPSLTIDVHSFAACTLVLVTPPNLVASFFGK